MGFRQFKRKQLDQSTRDEIMAHAQKIFGNVGYKEATVRQICKAAKANVCLVSYYFGGKDGLYVAVIENIIRRKIEFTQNQFTGNINIESREEYRLRLQIFIESFFVEQLAMPEVFRLINREVNEGSTRTGHLVEEFLVNVRSGFIEFIEYGIKKKFVKKGLDASLTCAAGSNMVMGFVAMLSLPGKSKVFFPQYSEKELPEKMLKTLIPIFIDGVMSNENN